MLRSDGTYLQVTPLTTSGSVGIGNVSGFLDMMVRGQEAIATGGSLIPLIAGDSELAIVHDNAARSLLVLRHDRRSPSAMPPPAVSVLPAELLFEIFAVAALSPLTASAVCGAWRRLALHTPALWTNVVVHDTKPEASFQRLRAFARRAEGRQLCITRIGGDDMDSESSAWDASQEPTKPLDDLILSLLLRCQRLEYLEIPSSTRACDFIIALVLRGAPRLRALVLEGAAMEVKFSQDIALRCMMRPRFPALAILNISWICMPYSLFNASNLEVLHVINACDSKRCQAQGAIGAHLAKLVHWSPALREIVLDGSWASASDLDSHTRLAIVDVMLPTVQNLSILDVSIFWFSRNLSRRAMPALTAASFLGSSTQPSHGISIYERAFLLPVLEFLAAAPNLERLSFELWITPIDADNASSLPRVTMPVLKSLCFNECHQTLSALLPRFLNVPLLDRLQDTDSFEYLT